MLQSAIETSGAPVAGPDAPRIPLATLADKRRIEATPLREICPFTTTLEILSERAKSHPTRPAVSFQLRSDPKSTLHTLSYEALLIETRRLANALHAAGVKPGETVALLLPNLPETVIGIFAGHAIGAVCPINPLLEPEIIASILREAKATALITLAPMPKLDISEKAERAAALAPEVKTIIEIDLVRYLSGPLRLIAPLMRPKRVRGHDARVVNYKRALALVPGDRFNFEREITPQTIGAYYHTGGTTGTPKLAQHNHGGMVFAGWIAHHLLIRDDDVMLCALPLFHVFASYPMAMASLCAGAHFVMLTPAGFRGEGVMDNFWKLVARHKGTFLCTVPTAIAALDQREVDADVSSLRYMISGSAPLPTALFERFEAKVGVKILEGYGMTEATCVTACNPTAGERKIGSVGLPLPFVDVQIRAFDPERGLGAECETDHIGEILFRAPSVFPGYLEEERNKDCFFTDEAGDSWLRTGDLGRVDEDGYIWITGRAKDLIIRGGHNIDPGVVEEALAKHPDVAFVGAIGQPDAYAGELPCAYVELRAGAAVTEEELKTFASDMVTERAARPATVRIVHELPKTGVGKIFKPELRREAIRRVFSATLEAAEIDAEISVEQDELRGMVAVIRPTGAGFDHGAVQVALSGFATPWRIATD